jgi:hypothetical protein
MYRYEHVAETLTECHSELQIEQTIKQRPLRRLELNKTLGGSHDVSP